MKRSGSPSPLFRGCRVSPRTTVSDPHCCPPGLQSAANSLRLLCKDLRARVDRMSVTKLDPEHLARILEAIDGHVEEVADVPPWQQAATEQSPTTYIVFDTEGDVLGSGLTADEAAVDALLRAHSQACGDFFELRERVCDLQTAWKRLAGE